MTDILKGKRCLIVDDEPDLREILSDQFSMEGVEAVVAENGIDGFAKFQSHKFDFIVSDVRMPISGGVDLLEKVRSHSEGRNIPFFLVTGFADFPVDEIFDRGANGVFPKPFDFEALLSGISRSLMPEDLRYKRTDGRAAADYLVEASFGDQPGMQSGILVNLSRGGFFCSGVRKFPRVGQTLEFRIQVAEASTDWIEGVGICRWVRERQEGIQVSAKDPATGPDKPGFGVEFLQLTDSSRRVLEKLPQFLKFDEKRAFIPKS